VIVLFLLSTLLYTSIPSPALDDCPEYLSAAAALSIPWQNERTAATDLPGLPSKQEVDQILHVGHVDSGAARVPRPGFVGLVANALWFFVDGTFRGIPVEKFDYRTKAQFWDLFAGRITQLYPVWRSRGPLEFENGLAFVGRVGNYIVFKPDGRVLFGLLQKIPAGDFTEQGVYERGAVPLTDYLTPRHPRPIFPCLLCDPVLATK